MVELAVMLLEFIVLAQTGLLEFGVLLPSLIVCMRCYGSQKTLRSRLN